MADRYGRKPVILSGLGVFVFGSILCLCGNAYWLFLIGRFLQGVGVAAPAILSFLIIADSYPLKQQQFLLAMLNGVMNTAVAIAPVIGSYLTLYFHWQGNFFALLLLGFTVFILTLFFIPSYKKSLVIAENLGSGYGDIFQSKPLMLVIITMLFVFAPYWVFVGISPLLYIKDLGVSLAHFGYYQGSLALVFAIGSVLYGVLVKYNDYQQKKMLLMTLQILIVSLLAIVLLSVINTTSPLLITLALIIFVVGQIIPSTLLYPWCLNFMPQAKGRISAIMSGGRLIFAALGLQMIGYFYRDSFQSVGTIITIFILLAIVGLFFVIRNIMFMNNSHE